MNCLLYVMTEMRVREEGLLDIWPSRKTDF